MLSAHIAPYLHNDKTRQACMGSEFQNQSDTMGRPFLFTTMVMGFGDGPLQMILTAVQVLSQLTWPECCIIPSIQTEHLQLLPLRTLKTVQTVYQDSPPPQKKPHTLLDIECLGVCTGAVWGAILASYIFYRVTQMILDCTYNSQEASFQHFVCRPEKCLQSFYIAYPLVSHSHTCTSSLQPHSGLFAPGICCQLT